MYITLFVGIFNCANVHCTICQRVKHTHLYKILSLALSAVDNTIEHTYRGFNNSVSLIDHFIVSENIQTHVEEYYTEDSIDNLSDHIPLFIQLRCIVESVPIDIST